MTEAITPTVPASRPAMARLLSDDRLALRATKGDRRAFAAIYHRYHQDLYRYCLAIVGDSQDAQDALQNTMVKVLGALPGEQRKIELKPWLYRIAHNESIDLLRRRRETGEFDPESAIAGPGLADQVELRERLQRLVADLDQLPERQRGVLVMRELAGLDFTEIGAALGTSPAVARQTLYEARLGLRQMDEGRAMSCERVTKALSGGDGRVARRRDLRAHLRSCASCRRFREEIDARERDLAALAPLPAVAAAGLLHSLLGGGHGVGGSGLAGALGGGAAKSIGGAAALKGVATVAVVAAIGVTAADRGGLVHLGLPDDSGSQATGGQQSAQSGHGAGQATQAPVMPVAADTTRPKTRDGSHIGTSHAAKATDGKAVGSADAKAAAEATPAPASQGSSVAHPHGRGHERQHPSSSAHGQQTAATHKAPVHVSVGTQGHPAHPPKPSHPPHSSNPSAENGPSSSPPSEAKHEAHGNAAPPDASAEEVPPRQGNRQNP
jgi:RNA polymerase sigma factor (sigma-70 family)